MAHSDAWQVRANYWHWVLQHIDLFIGLLECPYNTTAGSPEPVIQERTRLKPWYLSPSFEGHTLSFLQSPEKQVKLALSSVGGHNTRMGIPGDKDHRGYLGGCLPHSVKICFQWPEGVYTVSWWQDGNEDLKSLGLRLVKTLMVQDSLRHRDQASVYVVGLMTFRNNCRSLRNHRWAELQAPSHLTLKGTRLQRCFLFWLNRSS